jgi:hypothetical protein
MQPRFELLNEDERVNAWAGHRLPRPLYVYSPRLDWVGQYRVDEKGVFRREPAPGRIELTP